MNILDLIVIVLLVFYALNGAYRGFSGSVLNLGGFLVSWILSFITYPLLSGALSSESVLGSLKFYIEGSEKVGNVELAKTAITQLSETQIQSVVDKAALPPPFDTAILSNIKSQAFASQGVTSLGDYFNLTIFNVMINIISILLIFAALRILFTLLTNAFSYASKLPTLRSMDTLAGGLIGFVRGFLAMYMVFMLVPVVLIMINISAITVIFNSSITCRIFYSGSVVLRLISGVA